MAVGFNVSLLTFTPNMPARSADVNSNFTALKTAATYNFGVAVNADLSIVPDSTTRQMTMFVNGDFGLYSNTFAYNLRFVAGMTPNSKVVFSDNSNNFIFGFWDDGTYDYLDTYHAAFRIRTGIYGTPQNTVRMTSTNLWNISGTNYGFITAANATFNQGTSNADIAEPLLTEGDIQPGMAVCCSANDTVSPCSHGSCRVAKIVSTSPTILLMPRIQNDDAMTPIVGHESARAIVVGGVAPVQVVVPQSVKLRDRLTTAGPAFPGKLRVASPDEYALGDVIRIENDVVYAWIHY